MRSSHPYIKLDRLRDVPTLNDSMWGQIRWKPGPPDSLVMIGKDKDGAIAEVPLISGIDSTLQGSLNTSGSNPTVDEGANAGSTAAAVFDFGNDISGVVTVTCNGASIAAGRQIEVTFATARASTDFAVHLTPLSSQAADLSYYVTARTVNGFAIATVGAPAAGEVLRFAYLVIGDE